MPAPAPVPTGRSASRRRRASASPCRPAAGWPPRSGGRCRARPTRRSRARAAPSTFRAARRMARRVAVPARPMPARAALPAPAARGVSRPMWTGGRSAMATASLCARGLRRWQAPRRQPPALPPRRRNATVTHGRAHCGGRPVPRAAASGGEPWPCTSTRFTPTSGRPTARQAAAWRAGRSRTRRTTRPESRSISAGANPAGGPNGWPGASRRRASMTDPLFAPAGPVFSVNGALVPSMARDCVRMETDEGVEGLRTLRVDLFGTGAGAAGPPDRMIYLDGGVIDFGKQITVCIGSDGGQRTAFDGTISAIEAQFEDGESPLVRIFAEDALMRLRMTRRMRSYTDVTDADIADEIAREHGLQSETDVDGPRYYVVQQLNQSD